MNLDDQIRQMIREEIAKLVKGSMLNTDVIGPLQQQVSVIASTLNEVRQKVEVLDGLDTVEQEDFDTLQHRVDAIVPVCMKFADSTPADLQEQIDNLQDDREVVIQALESLIGELSSESDKKN
jgi:hypothetical protein